MIQVELQEDRQERRPDYVGPVLLTGHEYNKYGSFFFTEQGCLPENAVAVRVRPDDDKLYNLLFRAFEEQLSAMVAPAHRWWLANGELAWTIWSAKLARRESRETEIEIEGTERKPSGPYQSDISGFLNKGGDWMVYFGSIPRTWRINLFGTVQADAEVEVTVDGNLVTVMTAQQTAIMVTGTEIRLHSEGRSPQAFKAYLL